MPPSSPARRPSWLRWTGPRSSAPRRGARPSGCRNRPAAIDRDRRSARRSGRRARRARDHHSALGPRKVSRSASSTLAERAAPGVAGRCARPRAGRWPWNRARSGGRQVAGDHRRRGLAAWWRSSISPSSGATPTGSSPDSRRATRSPASPAAHSMAASTRPRHFTGRPRTRAPPSSVPDRARTTARRRARSKSTRHSRRSVGVQRETGEIAVEGTGTIEVSASADENLRRIDARETHASLRSLSRQPYWPRSAISVVQARLAP